MRMQSPSLTHLTRSLTTALALVLLGGAPLMPPAVQASETKTIDLSSSQQAGRMLRLGLQKSAVLKLPAVVKDVIVGNPGMVDVVLKNRNTAYLFARTAGQTNIFFLDAAGQQILQLDVEVTLDTKALKALPSLSSKALKRAQKKMQKAVSEQQERAERPSVVETMLAQKTPKMRGGMLPSLQPLGLRV